MQIEQRSKYLNHLKPKYQDLIEIVQVVFLLLCVVEVLDFVQANIVPETADFFVCLLIERTVLLHNVLHNWCWHKPHDRSHKVSGLIWVSLELQRGFLWGLKESALYHILHRQHLWVELATNITYILGIPIIIVHFLISIDTFTEL